MKIRQKIVPFFQSETVKNVVRLFSANVVAQIVGILVYPILTRLYSPADFGVYNLFLSIGGILVLLATAEYQYAIVLPKEEKIAINLLQLGAIITVTVAIVAVCLTPFSNFIAMVFNAPKLANFIWILPFFLLFMAFWNLLNYWLIRQKKFNSISSYQMSQSVTNAGLKLGFGFGGATGVGLIVSNVIALLVSLLMSLKSVAKEQWKKIFLCHKDELKVVAKTYANFPKYSLPRSLVNNISGNLPILILAPFFCTSEIGILGMALTLSFIPIGVISRSLYQVFFQKTNEKVNSKQSIFPFFKRYIKNTLLLILPLFMVLAFILPWLTAVLFGDEWRATGEYIRLMLPWLIMTILVSPICYISDIFQQQKKALYFEIAIILCRMVGLCIGICFQNFWLAILLYSIASTIVILAQCIWFMAMVKRYDNALR